MGIWPGAALEHPGIETRQFGKGYQGETLTRQLNRVLMLRPDYFAISEAHSPFPRHPAPVDFARAHTQWEHLCAAFQRAGLEVLLLDPQPGLDEMCFTANQSFAGIDREERSFVIPSRMLHRSRRDEVELFSRWYCEQGYRIVDLGLDGEEFLEGSGDLLWNTDRESVWAGFGHRSTRAAVDQFAALMESMGFEVRKLELVDPRFYHLDLCLAPLAPESMLLYPGAFAPETLARIRLWANTFEVTREEALQFICNGVSVNGYYITPQLSRHLEQVLVREGIEPIVVDLSEFQKAGGSVASLKMLLPRVFKFLYTALLT
jgi:N-dimethylarginine dimethylaminohydrolase